MKKIVVVLCAFMVIFLCACSSSASNESKASNTSNGIIEFNDIVLADNDVVTVKLVNFYEEKTQLSSNENPIIEKLITLKVQNKSDTDILFDLCEPYANDEAVTPHLIDGNHGPAAGKTKTFRYGFLRPGDSEHRWGIPLDSLDDLFSLEGTFAIYKDMGSYLEKAIYLDFSLAEIR